MKRVDEAKHDTCGADATGRERLPVYAAAYWEAHEILDAHRTRLRTVVLEQVDAGLPVAEAARLTGLSRVTVNNWVREAREQRSRPGRSAE